MVFKTYYCYLVYIWSFVLLLSLLAKNEPIIAVCKNDCSESAERHLQPQRGTVTQYMCFT